jgi:hypothetical protein
MYQVSLLEWHQDHQSYLHHSLTVAGSKMTKGISCESCVHKINNIDIARKVKKKKNAINLKLSG